MDHLTSKLGAAGMVDVALMAVTTTASAQLTLHTEKAAHITSKISAAGLDTGTGTTTEVKDTNTENIVQSNTEGTDILHHGPGTWIIVTVVVGLILISAAVGIFCAIKRRRRRYGAVGGNQNGRVMEKDVFNADMHEESEGLQQQEAGLRERNYESGYDNVDTHYDGGDYELKPTQGDKRAQYGLEAVL